MTRLFNYIVARDYGFAPNPFHGYCTLATCKPRIRMKAEVGDLVIGRGTVQQFPEGTLVYAMRVTTVLTFDEYWNDDRFRRKRPQLRGSRKLQYGDNIYRRGGNGQFEQADSHHSHEGGVPNPVHVVHDTSVDRVLVSDTFTYWGETGPAIPEEFRDWDGIDLGARQVRERWNYPQNLIDAFEAWLQPLIGQGYQGRPFSW